MFEKILATTEY